MATIGVAPPATKGLLGIQGLGIPGGRLQQLWLLLFVATTGAWFKTGCSEEVLEISLCVRKALQLKWKRGPREKSCHDCGAKNSMDRAGGRPSGHYQKSAGLSEVVIF